MSTEIFELNINGSCYLKQKPETFINTLKSLYNRVDKKELFEKSKDLINRTVGYIDKCNKLNKKIIFETHTKNPNSLIKRIIKKICKV
jgi:hypothetical protein